MTPLIDATKKCNVCNIIKPITAFHPNKQCKQGVVGTCRICTGERISEWYFNNQKRRQQVVNEKNKNRKREVVEHFGNKCADCKNSFPQYVYQFHHLDPTKKDVNPSYAMSKRPSEMWKELDKCVMLCANCHMIRHYGKEGVNDSTTH